MARHWAVLILLLAVACEVGAAQVALDPMPPSRAQVLQLMSAMGVQQNVDASLMATQAKVKVAARSSFQKKNPNADAATLKKLDTVFDATPLFNFEAISEPLVAVYQKNLSAADVQAGIDFYTSDAGKRLREKLPVIQRESNASGGKLVQQKLMEYSAELERKLEAFQAELDQQKPAADKTKAADDKSKTTDEKSK
jgi:hypothetical protein